MSAVSMNPLQHPQLRADVATVNSLLDNSEKGVKNQKFKCLMANPNHVTLKVVTGSVAGGAAGAAAGAAVLGLPALVLAPPSAGVAAKVGAGIGLAAGLFLGAKVTYDVVEFPQVFAKWKEQAIAKKVYPLFEKYLGEEVIDFQCPITMSLVSNPVRDVHGCVFERSEIERQFKEAETIGCPKTTRAIRRDELVPDLNYHRGLLARFKPRFDAATADPNVVSAVLALQQQVEEVQAQTTFSKIKDLLCCLNKAKTKEEKGQIMLQITARLCGEGSEDTPSVISVPDGDRKDEKTD